MKALYSKKRFSRLARQGFTMVETLVTVSIMVAVIAMSLRGVMLMQKKSQKEYTQTELDLDLRMATQRLQIEMRLSAMNEMTFYPSGAKKYTAVSFPANKTGSLSKTNGVIVWDSTVIYHVSEITMDNGQTQSRLLRTVFSNRNNTLSTADRQQQLDQVVADGDGEQTEATGESASTTCLFEHVFNWEIIPEGSRYDGYASWDTLDRKAFLGSFNLQPGVHTIQFEVIGKNPLSTGYRIGLDTISFSHAQGIREAEDQAVDGSVLPTVEHDQGHYSNYRKLIFDATAEGQTFEIKLYNDRWEDTLFNSIGADATNNVTCGYDSDYAPPEVTLRLNGSTTNQFAYNQTGDLQGTVVSNDVFSGSIVRTLIKGEAIQTGANGGISHEGAGCSLAFFCAHESDSLRMMKIKAAYIDECSSHIDATPDTIGNPKQITFNNGDARCFVIGSAPVWSDLLDYPIHPEKNYAVTYEIQSYDIFRSYPKAWDSNTNIVNSYYVPKNEADVSDLTASSWSENTNVVESTAAIGVGEIYVSYPAVGFYTSAPFDTHIQNPQYESMDWDQDCPSGTQLNIEVRSASKSDMSDASEWKYISSPGSIGIDYRQYVQYRVELASSAKGLQTPKLKRIAIQWPGITSATHLSGTFVNGPDFGQFKTLIDGQELASPLRVNLEVKKHPFGQDITSDGTLISETSFELTPRNSN